MNHAQFWGGAAAPYEIEQSLRFDGGSYLSRTPGSAGNRRTCTLSFWFKWESQGGEGVFLWASGRTKLAIDPGGFDALSLDDYDGSFNIRKLTTQSLRDPSAWYHAVVVMDTTNATAGDRHRLYLNGERITAFSTSTDSGQNFDTEWNNNVEHRIGADNNPFYFRGYIAEMHMLDGTAVTDALDFGEYDDNGVWRPIEVSGVTYGTNGYYLKFDPSATNGIGHDHSGNGNNWTASGFTTSGTGTDVMSDTPTTNWCTLNPVFNTAAGSITSDGNLKASFSSDSVTGTVGPTSGKYYFEVTVDSISTNAYIGIADETLFVDTSSFSYSQVYVYLASALKGGNGSTSSYGATYGAGDVIGVAFDLDTPSIRFYKNGVDQGEAFNSINNTGSAYRPFSFAQGGGQTFNFGQRAFAYTPPTGFKALNTSNLPAPDIADGSQNMMAVLWTGTGAARTQAGYNFQPDLLWIMRRDGAGMNVRLHDVVRGDNGTVMYRLGTNNTDNEDTDTDVTGLTSTGFTIGNDGTDHPNVSGYTYVGWGWKAAQNSGSSNTDGSITSTVSANPTAGFSIVTYTGTNANATVGHGLGVAPKMVICKSRNSSSHSWYTYHASLGSSKYVYLNLTAAAGTGAAIWNGDPTSTVFTLGTSNGANQSTVTYVAYCFAEVEGYSKFGSYTGNGLSDGPFVYCGFKPAFVMTKNTVGTQDWQIRDDKRLGYNPTDRTLAPNDTRQENNAASSYEIDFLSNGFKIRGGLAAINGSGNAIVFAAFASSPFGGSNVSPATAR